MQMWSRPTTCRGDDLPGISNLMSVKAAVIASTWSSWVPKSRSPCVDCRRIAMCARVASADRKLRARRSSTGPQNLQNLQSPQKPHAHCHVSTSPLFHFRGGMPTAASHCLDFFVWFVVERMLATCPTNSGHSAPLALPHFYIIFFSAILAPCQIVDFTSRPQLFAI